LHLYLARSATALVAVQIEDLLGETLPVNVPGTDRQYPNWQRRVSVDVEDLAERADIAVRLEEIRMARG
jgi:4-alpha-glucanotransferase